MTAPLDRPGLELVDRLLKTGELVDRWDAARELVRVLAQRETTFPRLIQEKTITEAEAALRNARLACAWIYTVDPRAELTGPHRYLTDLERALWLAEARGYVLAPTKKGTR